jgi:hypothetical protein
LVLGVIGKGAPGLSSGSNSMRKENRIT